MKQSVSTQQLAKLIRACETTIAEWRRRGVGPSYRTLSQRVGFGPKVYYPVNDLLAYTHGRWPKDGRFVTTKQAASLMGISTTALRQRRRRGGEPVPVYFETLVRYLPEDCV